MTEALLPLANLVLNPVLGAAVKGIGHLVQKRRTVTFTFTNNSSKVLVNPSHPFWCGKVEHSPAYKIESGTEKTGGKFKGRRVKGVLWYEIEDTEYVLLAIVKVKWFRGVRHDNKWRNRVGAAIVPQKNVTKKQDKKTIYRNNKTLLQYCDGQPSYHTYKPLVNEPEDPPSNVLKVMYNITSAGNATAEIITEDPPP